MAAADVLSPPSPPDLEVLEDERVLGASTADQAWRKCIKKIKDGMRRLARIDPPLNYIYPV